MALLVSLAVHAVIVAPWPHFNLFSRELEPLKEERDIEVNYLEIKIVPKPPSAYRRPPPKQVKVIPKTETSTPGKAIPQAPKITRKAEKSITIAKTEPKKVKPLPKKPQIQAEPKEWKEGPQISQESHTPELARAYMDYYERIRQKIIYSLAKMHKNRFRKGEVYIEFTLSSSGILKNARILESRSTPSNELKYITLNALQKSSPFPSFPQELNDPHIDFNVVVSFRK